jgi:SagB-type dehydrogenase family enzyme
VTTNSEEGVGDIFQQQTCYEPSKIGGHNLDWSKRPNQVKNHESTLEIIQLPKPYFPQSDSLWSILQNRRSIRAYLTDKSIQLDMLSTLLWAVQGETASYGDVSFRTSPSAGALHPIETYLFVRAVNDLKKGIYHFRPHLFDLEFLREGDFSHYLAQSALGQGMVMNAQVTFIWTAIAERSKWKYRQRAYRYIYLDAGHIGENLYLAGQALGLGVCAIGAFFDSHVNNIISVDGIAETVIYMAAVGLPKRDRQAANKI